MTVPALPYAPVFVQPKVLRVENCAFQLVADVPRMTLVPQMVRFVTIPFEQDTNPFGEVEYCPNPVIELAVLLALIDPAVNAEPRKVTDEPKPTEPPPRFVIPFGP
jgi:hypothetical protein